MAGGAPVLPQELRLELGIVDPSCTSAAIAPKPKDGTKNDPDENDPDEDVERLERNRAVGGRVHIDIF